MNAKTVDLERGMPTLAWAMTQMRQSVTAARANRVDVLKLIHGYGSSGRGGVIRTAARKELAAMTRDGKIRAFIPGEEFSPFESLTQEMLLRYPDLAKDRDYLKTNHGVTLVILR